MFLARPLRDQCSSVPKSVQQSRAKVAHGLFTFVASSRHLRRIGHGAVPRISWLRSNHECPRVRGQLSASAGREGLVASMHSSKKKGGLTVRRPRGQNKNGNQVLKYFSIGSVF